MLNHRGFTLMELMVTIAVFGILMVMGLPMYSTWMANMRIRGAAEALQNGLQVARTTAIGRNTNVYFVLPTAGSLDQIVYAVNSASAMPADFQAPDGTLIDMVRQFNQAESTSGTSVTNAPAGAYMVAFGSLGQVVVDSSGNNIDGSPVLKTVDVDPSSTSTDPSLRPMRVLISAGGAIKTCDRSVTDPTDFRFCPATF